MTLESIIFYFFIGLTILPAFFILFTKNVLYAAFALLITFLGVGGLYVFSMAEFLAVAQVLIYVGGILVLILFGVMLTNRMTGQEHLVAPNRSVFIGILIGLVIFGLLTAGIIQVNYAAVISQSGRDTQLITGSTIGKIGDNLMTVFALPFEVAAILLLAALIGAAFLASQIVKKNE